MSRRILRKIVGTGLVLGLSTPIAYAQQMNVDSRFHSSGSCASCDLSNKTMTRLNLKNADFSGSNFNRSNLSGGKFVESNLTGARFRKAYLVRLQGDLVDMSGAVFQDATLTEATLNKSVLTKSNMRRADLSRVTFSGSDFSDSDFTSAIAPDARFPDSQFVGAQFNHINLQNAVLDRGNFRNAKFGDAILVKATMQDANLSGADLRLAQGLTQVQLDTACGDYNTRLPSGLSIPYCETAMMAETVAHDMSSHTMLNPKLAKAARRLDEAIADIELMMKNVAYEDKKTRRKLQNIHAKMVSSRRNIEQ